MAEARPQPKHKPADRPGMRAVEPNLIITIDERHRDLAVPEIEGILARLALKARITGSPGEGLVGVYVADDPRACIARLRAMLAQDPFAFQHTHRWLPIEQWAAAEAREVAHFAEHALAEIAPDESWSIRAERHSSRLEPSLLVNALARDIDNRHVSLEDPDKTVLMEIVGQRAGLAVVQKDQVLSVDQEMKGFLKFEELP
jgi:tRNA acetyltransferase TAN1